MAEQARVSTSGGLVELYATATVCLTAQGGYIESHSSSRVEDTATGAYVESYVPFYRVRLFAVALATLTTNASAMFSDVHLYMPTAASAMLVPLPLDVRTVNASILRLPCAKTILIGQV